MEYFKEDALNEMVAYLRHSVIRFKHASEITNSIVDVMFIYVFNSKTKFDSTAQCFEYIDNKASAFYEMMVTLKENKYCDGSIEQTFNNYWFYVGVQLIGKGRKETIATILERL